MDDREWWEDDMVGIGDRGLGMELRTLREQSGISLEKVAALMGWSMSMLSRLERGMRPDTAAEDFATLLGIIRAPAKDRLRFMKLVAARHTQGLWADHDADFSDQTRIYLTFERSATRITNVEPFLVPGLLQTSDYCRTVLRAFNVDESKILGRMARRLGRQQILEQRPGPQLRFIVTELALRQPFGSRLLMAQQVRRIAEEAQRPNVSVLVVPQEVVAHPGLHGAFVLLEFAEEPAVVFIEGRLSGLFPENTEEIEAYRVAAEKEAELALDEPASLELLVAIAEDLERAR
jgi:transcriptional regulator with XRE-family HTH domain